MPRITTRLQAVLLLTTVLLLSAAVTQAEDKKVEAQSIVDTAIINFQNFRNDPNMTWFRDNVNQARGIMIVPKLLKAGFIFGGSGGTGVFLARDRETDLWSDPAFYTMGSVTWGLQIGGQVAEVVLLVMTQGGIDAMLSNKFQLGGDASIAAGPVGAGAQAATVDILQFSRAKGVFGGLTVEGAIIGIRDDLNNAFYGQPVTPVDILVQRNVSSQGAAALVDTVSEGAGS